LPNIWGSHGLRWENGREEVVILMPSISKRLFEKG
jgi:hypothetical protein